MCGRQVDREHMGRSKERQCVGVGCQGTYMGRAKERQCVGAGGQGTYGKS